MLNFNDYEIPKALYDYPIVVKMMHLWNGMILQRNWHVYARLNKEIPRKFKGSILDAGSGDGQFLFWLKEHFSKAKVMGIDKLQSNVDFANHHLKGDYCQLANIETFESEEKFDFILMVAVFPYLKDDIATLQRLAKRLKPGGRIILYTSMNGRQVLPFYRRILNLFKHYDTVHERFWNDSDDQLQTKFEQAGLTSSFWHPTMGTLGIISQEIYSMLLTIVSSFKSNLLVLIFVFVVMVPLAPWLLLMNAIDFIQEKNSGNGLLVELKNK